MKKKKLLTALTAMCMCVSAFFPGFVPTPVEASEQGDVRVATFNIAATRNASIAELSSEMQEYGIELAGIQEVDINTSRNPIDMMEEFMNAGYFTDNHFQKAIDYGGGEYGIGILSTSALRDKSGGALISEGISEARAYARAVYTTAGGKEIAFYNTHLTHENKDARQQQLAQVLQIMDEDPAEYKVLTGDFNTDTDVSENYPMLKNYDIANGYDGTWYPTCDEELGSRAIDNIIVSRNIEIVSVGMDQNLLSDHHMLYADLNLLDEAQPSTQLMDRLVEDAKAVNAEEYTEESYAAVSEALSAAAAVDTASQDAINAVCDALQNAMNALITAEKEIIINDTQIGTGLNQFNYVGAWQTSTGYPEQFYNGDEHWFNFARYQEGDTIPYFEIRFEGVGIEIYGNKDTVNGIYEIYIDGEHVTDVDCYNPQRLTQQLIYGVNDLEYGEHTLKLQLTQRKNDSATSSDGEVDYAKIIREKETVEVAPTVNLIPKPRTYQQTEGYFTLGPDAQIAVIAEDESVKAEMMDTGEYIAEVFRASTGYDLSVIEQTTAGSGDITLRLDQDGGYAEEGYSINTTSSRVIIEAGTSAGIFYGVQTLRQMFPSEIESETLVNDVTWNVPCSSLSDEPEYGLRSMMLDVTRHFFTVDQVKRQLDMLSQYKINTLHMHLSDDQGWRLEIKGEMYGESLDKLRTIGAQTSCNTNGIRAGQYTQEEFKEIVAYANERHIQIIPEFDMPSHAWAALVSLSFLNSTEDGRPPANGYDNTRPYEGWDVGFNSLECRNEKTYEFIDEVFRQVSEISPSKYIHIGGDEAHVTSHDDYVYFMNRVTEIAKKYGKTPIGWQNYDTAVENPEGTVTQFWSTGNAKFEEGINYVVSPADHAYMDMKYDSDCPYGLEWATHNPVDDSYNWDPTDYGSKDQIVGVETCLFTETIATDEALDYMIYPRVLGHAEIGWTAKEDRSWDEYKTRLATHDERLELQGIGYKRDAMIWYNPVNFRMPMDEGSGTTIDAASGPYSGTMNGGVSWTEGKYGTALHLDGTSGYIDIGAPDVQDEWTIGMWVNREAAEGNNAALISGTQGELKIEQYKDTKKVGVTKYGEVDAAFDYELPEGEWVHLTFTGNSEGVNLYVNGEYSGHLDVVMNGPASRIGANSASGLADMGYMKGSVDDLQIYNSVLSEEEIAEMMEDPYGFGEEAYWTMNEGEGETITDESGQNTGTLTNVGWSEGQEGTALTFNGDGYADLGYRDIIGEWTVALWVNAGETTGTNSVLVSGNQGEIKLDQYSNTGMVGITEFGVADHTFNYSAPKGEWVHLTFVSNSKGTTLYVNGEEQDHLDATINGPAGKLGASGGTGLADTGYLSGSVDELRIYARALSANEVAEIAGVEHEDTTLAKTILKSAIDSAEEVMAAEDYEFIVPSVRELIETRYAEAVAVYEDENATVAECMDAWTNLANALQYAEFKGDKRELQALVDEVRGMDLSGYTEDSISALNEALDAAQAVLDDEDALQDSIDEAYDALNAAIEALEEISEPSEPASEAAIQALRNMVDKANALGSDDAALNAAIDNAQAILDKEAPTATEVVIALLDLSEAMQALNTEESADALRADVQATIDFINANILTNVNNIRPAKVQALRNAITAAQYVLANKDATADQLKAANEAMTKAAQELWEIVTKAELEALIEAANGYLDGDYTAESLEALQAVITNAQSVANNDDATTAEVTDAITSLANAIAGLESITLDTSALEHEIELAEQILANIDDYVPSTVEGLQEKVDAAKAALSATSQEEIDAATESLREARLNARTKADVSALEELVAYVNSLELSAYTSVSAQPVIQNVARAKAMLMNAEVTQEEVNDMVKTLQASVDNLVEVSTDSTTAGTDTTDTTNTSAAAQSGMMFALLAAAGAATVIIRRKRS